MKEKLFNRVKYLGFGIWDFNKYLSITLIGGTNPLRG
jgi:hypothetical protein